MIHSTNFWFNSINSEIISNVWHLSSSSSQWLFAFGRTYVLIRQFATSVRLWMFPTILINSDDELNKRINEHLLQMQKWIHVSSCYLLGIITIACGVRTSLRIIVDGQHLTWHECFLATHAHQFHVKPKSLKADFVYTLKLAQKRIKSLIIRERNSSGEILHITNLMEDLNLNLKVCNLKSSAKTYVEQQLSLLRQAALCLGVSRRKHHIFPLESAICSLETMIKLSGDIFRTTSRNDVIHRYWKTKYMQAGTLDMKLRDYLILRDVSEALEFVLRQSEQTV